MKIIGNGKLFVVSAPSGAGKTTVVQGALKKLKSMRLSVSWTTRKPRRGEKDGRDYKFVEKKQFAELIRKNGLLEWAKVFGQFYGTPKSNIIEARKNGYDLFLVIDVQGASQVRKRVKDAVLVFILPPGFETLYQRLKKRGKDSPAKIRERLKIARLEIRKAKNYDYAIVNDKLAAAVTELVEIVKTERQN
jgi:guanylate kinase